MIKTYILDISALIQAPYAVDYFKENYIMLSMVMLEELDNLKEAEGEWGVNTRASIHMLEQLHMRGDLLKGVTPENGGTLRVEENYVDVEPPPDLPEEKVDNRILKVCRGPTRQQGVGKSRREKPPRIILVTKNILLHIKAQIIGIRAEDFITEQVSDRGEQYTGRYGVFIPEEDVKESKKEGIPVDKAYISDESDGHSCPQLWENQFLLLKVSQPVKKTLLGRAQGNRIVPLEYKKSKPYSISPKNSRQYLLQEAPVRPANKAPLVIVKGMARTAKTFYSLAVGLEKLLNNPTEEYRRIIISHPNAQFNADIGSLPGDEQEKVSPLMKPVTDNLEQLIDSSEEKRYEDEAELKGKVDEIFDRGLVQTEALNYIRGRSIVKTCLIIGEAQNMTPNRVKSIITRAGMGTRVILLDGPNQVDRTFLDERTNRLSYTSEHIKGSGLCWQTTLNAGRCERSELAMDAVRRL